MKKKTTTVTFKGTEEQKAKLMAVIEKYKGKEGKKHGTAYPLAEGSEYEQPCRKGSVLCEDRKPCIRKGRYAFEQRAEGIGYSPGGKINSHADERQDYKNTHRAQKRGLYSECTFLPLFFHRLSVFVPERTCKHNEYCV